MSLFKCFLCSLFLAGCIDLVFNSISARKGYVFIRLKWDNYKNLPLEDVKRNLSLEMPGVGFAIYAEDTYGIYSEEFYLNEIRLVINGTLFPVVVLPPVFAGYEPDVQLVKDALGLPLSDAVSLIQNKIPHTKIVSPPNVTFDGDDRYPGHILLETDDSGTVVSSPRLVRNS